MQHVDTKVEIARLTASTAVITIAGITLNEWVAIFTIVYLTIQSIIMMPKAYAIVCFWVQSIKNYIRGFSNAKENSTNE